VNNDYWLQTVKKEGQTVALQMLSSWMKTFREWLLERDGHDCFSANTTVALSAGETQKLPKCLFLACSGIMIIAKYEVLLDLSSEMHRTPKMYPTRNATISFNRQFLLSWNYQVDQRDISKNVSIRDKKVSWRWSIQSGPKHVYTLWHLK
jgi:hypothetical protein